MCLLIVAPQNTTIPADYVVNAWDNNPDGAGISYLEGDKVVITKGLMTLEDLQLALATVGDATHRIVHFRFATKGEVSEDNTHPFALEKSASAVAHNGPCVSPLYQGDKVRSDTRHLAEDLLSKFDAPTLRDMQPMLEGFIASGNKLAFLFADGDYMIVGEHHGTWLDGIWLSNLHSIEAPYKFTGWKWNSKSGGIPSEFDDSITLYYAVGTEIETTIQFTYDYEGGEFYSLAYSMTLAEMCDWIKENGGDSVNEYTSVGVIMFEEEDLLESINATKRVSTADLWDDEYVDWKMQA